MIDLEHVSSFAREVSKYLEERRKKMEEVAEEEIKAAMEDDDIEEDPHPLFDKVSSNQHDFYVLTGFRVNEFERLFNDLETCLTFKGRGRRTKFHPKDVLVLLLIYIRRYPRFEEMSAYFKIKVSTLEKIILRAIDVASKVVKRNYIEALPLDELPSWDPFNDCTLIVDATVQAIPRPKGPFEAIKPWYSGKHEMYCLKSQVVINRAGLAVHIVSSKPGSIHDLKILKESMPDIDKFLEQFPDHGKKILADKGYVCDELNDRLVTPHKGNMLTHEQIKFNEQLSKVRIKVENFFGRMKNCFMITSEKYRGDQSKYNDIFCLCAGLVNFQIGVLNKPLNKDDHDFFCRHHALLHLETQNRREKEAEKRKRQKEARIARINLQ